MYRKDIWKLLEMEGCLIKANRTFDLSNSIVQRKNGSFCEATKQWTLAPKTIELRDTKVQ